MAVVLSIIVPVYNVRPYLEKCVQSLLNQDLSPDEYEIILVDDGSTDGGGELCEQIKKQRDTIRVIHQPNQGLSSARNTGMRIAQGKYVQFVDSDDWIEPCVLQKLVRKMDTEDLDVLRFDYRRVDEFGRVTYQKNTATDDGAEIIQSGKDFLLNHLWYSCYACQFMLRRFFLMGNALFFLPNIIFEDTEWTPRVLQIANRVCGIGCLVYNYLERSGSITKGIVQKRLDGHFRLIDELKFQMSQVEDKRWYQGMIAQIVVTVLTTLALELYDSRKVSLDRLKKEQVFPLSLYQATKKTRRKIRIINASPAGACFLIHVSNRFIR
ncbi:MAG: glycosyltransferase [Bacteroidales bacterium]|nr:glycosyltransferase [Bacteroidales bacterium]